jgi:ribosomal protein S12 methylthiotransferase accessory factor
MTVQLSSSLRASPPEATLARAKLAAGALGITRVTDITRLDRVGIPVYASIRPGAAEGSLCVNAGKGLRPIEAEVGAYMEAIEFALAEPAAKRVPIFMARARDVLDGRRRREAILDLCPRLGAKIVVDAPMDCVEAEEITTGERALVPAELVFLPYRPNARFRGHFGTSSNGLASGNTVEEATVHALSELIERDIKSFEAIRDTSRPVDLRAVRHPLVTRIRDAGLELHVRTARNIFGLPYFFAILHDPDACAPHLLNAGYGCHLHRNVAFVRAVAEAAQSRLSFIHGGRDDLTRHHEQFAGWSFARKRAFVTRVVVRASAGEPIAFTEVEDHAREATTIARALSLLVARLAAAGLRRVYRVCLTRPDEKLQVVRMIVPGLELFNETTQRVGFRIREHARRS